MTYSIDDLRDPTSAIAAISKRLAGRDRAAPLLAELANSDPAARIAGTVADLERSFAMLGERRYLQPGAHGRPSSLLSIYFAGSEIEPWYPQQYWLSAWGEEAGQVVCNADTVGGGDLFAVAPLYDAIEAIDAADDDDLVNQVRRLFVLTAWTDVVAAIAPALASDSFARLPTARPFRVVATPGHDEPELELAQLER